jgi:MFS family permease
MAAPSISSAPAALHSASGRPLTNRWVALALLLLVAILNYADRFLMSGLAQPVKAHFGVSDALMGALMGPAFALLYAIFSLPLARLADRHSRVMIVAIGCGVWSFFTMLSGMATTPAMLAVARVGVGIGEAAYQAPAAALIAAYFPLEQRGRAFALLGTAIYFGQMMGFAGGPAIAAAYDWRTAFHALGIAGIVIAIATMLVVREPAREAATLGSPPLRLGATIRLLMATPTVRHLAALLTFGTLSGVTFAMWGTALFERAYGLSTEDAGAIFALSFGLPGLFGTLGFGFIADRIGRKDPAAIMRLAAIALGSCTALVLAVVWANSLVLARTLAVPAGLLGGGWSVAVMAGMQYLLPSAHRATGTALVLLIAGLFATVIGPVVAGQLSDWIAGAGATGLRVGLTVAVPTAYFGVWGAIAATRTLERDRAQLHAG